MAAAAVVVGVADVASSHDLLHPSSHLVDWDDDHRSNSSDLH